MYGVHMLPDENGRLFNEEIESAIDALVDCVLDSTDPLHGDLAVKIRNSLAKEIL